jgi:hypothetical protein
VKYQPKNTLSYFKAAPQFHRIRLAHLPTKAFGESTKLYRKDCGEVSPDEEALKFYALNHLASLVEKNFTLHEPLPEWAVEVRQKHLEEVVKQGNRMLHYILSICTREMRHIKNAETTTAASFWGKLEKAYGKEIREFIFSLKAMTENVAVSTYMDKAPKCSLGNYIAGLAWAFHNGSWDSNYGGKAWGVVADACVSFVEGKTSLEALVDTGYTLAHNNGPIFNKGMMYAYYSGHFMTILDVQRSGQIPELFLDKKNYGTSEVTNLKEIKDLVKRVQTEYPKEFLGYVSWTKVEKLGALGKYSSWVKEEKVEHPEKVEPPKPTVIKMGSAHVKIKELGNWEMFPGESAKIFERVKG